jgi:ATP/maltotriose-dependent transcriptional regulator MalT/predicted Ser/Thr protein kinase
MQFEDRMDLSGKRIGQYQVVESIGQGGMASVFKAYQSNLDRYVAIKVLPAQHALTPGFAERFEREAKAVALLNHPNILPIIDYGQEGDLTYIVMKYVQHGTLADRTGKPIEMALTTRLIEQIAAALDHAHSRGIIHRDIKPSNVLLDEGDWVQLADFGLARVLSGPSELTASGASMGSPAFISPEQGQGLPLDHHTDIYSLGVVLYEMATGQLPFSAETAMTLVFKHIYEEPPAPRSINPALSAAIEAVILKAMSKTTADRYHSAGDLARDLRLAVSGSAAFSMPGALDRASGPIAPIGSLSTINLDERAVELMIETIPAISHFIGREKELANYRARLQRDGFIVITGMAGAGKTTLGAKLAHEVAKDAKHIFWYTFDQIEQSTVDALLWALGAFFESHGDHNLWRYLNNEPESQKPLDRMVRMNLLLAGLTANNYVLCFDDLQLVERVPEIAYVFKMMRQRLTDRGESTASRVILLGRQVSRELESFVTAPLSGFDYEDAAAFVMEQPVHLPAAIVRRLWERTEGNAKLLELSVSAIDPLAGEAAAVDRFVEAMSRKGDVRDYLMSNIYGALRDDEKLIMGALSVFPNSIEREAAQNILEAENIDEVVTRIDALIARHLLDESDHDQIHCHGLVRDYCYHVLSRADKDRFHLGAAEYFEAQQNYLAAAHHYFEKRDYARAIDLLATHSSIIINSGGAGGLLAQLSEFQKKFLSSDHWVALCKTTGSVRQIRGEYQAAIEAYWAALAEPIGEKDRSEILRSIALTYLQAGDYDRSIDYATQSFNIDQKLNNRRGMIDYYFTLGGAEHKQGHLDQAAEQYAHCEQLIAEQPNDLLEARVKMPLGIIAWQRKNLQLARDNFEHCRRIYHAHGDRAAESRAIGNLGLVYGELNEIDQQLVCYRQAIEILEELGDVDGLQYGFNNLGYLYYTLHDYRQSIHYYDRLRQLAKDIGQKRMLCLAYAGLADAYLAEGDLYRASEYTSNAQVVGEELGLGREAGVAERAAGDVWLKLGDLERARAAYERGIPMLEEANEFEELAKARQGLARMNDKLAIYRGTSQS